MNRPDGIEVVCPRCGARNRSGATACFLCGDPIDPFREGVNPYAPPKAAIGPGSQFQLGTLLLVVALIAVCLGVYQEAPGLGVLLAVLSFIALSRTVIISSGGRIEGRPLSTGDKVAVFFATIGVAVLVFVCVGVALSAACFALFAAGGAFGAPGAWVVVALPVVIGLLWGMTLLARRLTRVRSIGIGPDRN